MQLKKKMRLNTNIEKYLIMKQATTANNKLVTVLRMTTWRSYHWCFLKAMINFIRKNIRCRAQFDRKKKQSTFCSKQAIVILYI